MDINNPTTMSQTRVNLAAAKRELAERQDEANLCMVELKHAQGIVEAGGTGPKVLSVRQKAAEREREGQRKSYTVERERASRSVARAARSSLSRLLHSAC